MLGEEISGPPLPAVPFHTVPELIAACALADPPRPAVRCRGPSGRWQDLTWSALDARRRAVAAGLALLGVKRGDVVAFVGHNSAEMTIGEFAAHTLGAAVAPILPGYSPDVLHHCLNDPRPRLAVAGTAGQHPPVA